MKNGWQTRPLGDLCEFQRGLTYAKADEVDVSGNVVLRASNIDLSTNQLDFADLRYISDKVRVPENRKVRKGSLLICTASGSKSHLGKVAYIDNDYEYAFGGFMGMITPTNGVLPKYLFYLMTSPAYKDFISALSDGANINNLKFDDLRRFLVCHPSLPEQRRIVGILDEAFAAIATAKANAERNLQNARAVIESWLNALFVESNGHRTEQPLGNLCREITVGHVGTMAEHYRPTGIPFLRSQNIRPFRVAMENSVFIDRAFHATLVKSQLKPGDVAIVRTGYPGTAAVIPECLAEANCSDLVIARPSAQIDAHYLAAFFNSAFGKRLVSGSLNGAAQKHFNVTAAKTVSIALPSIAEQRVAVAQTQKLQEEAQRLEVLHQRKLIALDELKKSLLHRAFSGKL
jgi:type I restriction enzyme S subunit